MEEYCRSRKLGPALGHEASANAVELPVVVAEYSAAIDSSLTGATWADNTRDVATEVVVPFSVLEALGPDVFAGQLVSITCATSPKVKHVARLVPIDLCKEPLLSPAAADANGLDVHACTVSGKPAALLSPVLAFNLGIPYQIAQLMALMQPDAAKRRGPRRSTVTLAALPPTWPDDSDDAAKATPWTPGNSSPTLHAATHIGLAICATAEVLPPFHIEDFQEELQEAAKALQGKPKTEEEDADKNALDPLTEQERENRDKEMMSALTDFTKRKHFVCLGDVVVLETQRTPLVGPMHTAHSEGPAAERKLVYMKIVELTSHTRWQDHKNDVPRHAICWGAGCNIMISHGTGSAFPVGADAFFLDRPPAAPAATEGAAGASSPGDASAEDGAKAPELGRTAHSLLAPMHTHGRGRLLTGVWRGVATQMLPYLHPAAKDDALSGRRAGGAGRAALLLTGPERAGKALEAHAAGAALGVNVMEVDCRALSNASPMDDAECVANLEAQFVQMRMHAPGILLLRRLDRIFPQQPNLAVVRRFADALVALSAHCCAPHLPEVSVLPEPDEEPQEPELLDLPWRALHTAYAEDGTRYGVPEGVSRAKLGALHERFAPGAVMVVATTSHVAELPVALRRSFTDEISVPALDEGQRERALAHTLEGASGLSDGDVRGAAQATAGFLPCDLAATACDAVLQVMLRELSARHAGGDAPATAAMLDGKVRPQHIEGTLEEVRKRTALDLGAPRIPAVQWDDVGGLEHVKRAILETIELPLRYRDLFASGVKRRSGVLLYGPPGTGKTLIAKAVATECAINFMSIKGPELINMYVGESEKNVRDVFEKARKAQPCILFFDELDSLAPRRGNGMDSSHVSDRIVAQLLAELDGIGGGRNDVYVIGATNRPDLLDSALLRPGRLDVLLYVGVDRSAESKGKVLRALTRKFTLAPDADVTALASALPVQCTGADLYGLCADAWMHALRRKIAELTAAGRVGETDEAHDYDDVDIAVCGADLEAARANLVPSLTVADLDKYDALEEKYAPRKAADAPAAGKPKRAGKAGGLGALPRRRGKGGANGASKGTDAPRNGDAANEGGAEACAGSDTSGEPPELQELSGSGSESESDS